MDVTTSPAPLGSPTTCVYCKTHKDPRGFAYGPEIQHYGIVWICSACCKSLGKAFGQVDGREYADIVALARRQDGEIAGLRAELEIANSPANKVVPLDELAAAVKAVVIDLDAERAKRRSAAKASA